MSKLKSNNYYEVLGVKETATQEEIKKAYRRLSLEHHPDRNGNTQKAIEMMANINEAYDILSNEQTKDEYDYKKKSFFPFTRNSGEMPNVSQNLDNFIHMFFEGGDMFDPFIVRNGRRGGPNINMFDTFHMQMQKPVPIIKNITISFFQVYTGATIPIEIERWIYENGIKVMEKETVYVTIPQGIDENEIIILKDKGNVVSELLMGDIKIFVNISNNTEYKRVGLDLVYNKTISLKEALCGFSLQFTFINGKTYTLNNLSGNIITPEYKKLIPGMGLTRGSHQGNLIVVFHVQFPETLTEEQSQVLKNVL
jgi:DnaJ-class molecular chaperone